MIKYTLFRIIVSHTMILWKSPFLILFHLRRISVGIRKYFRVVITYVWSKFSLGYMRYRALCHTSPQDPTFYWCAVRWHLWNIKYQIWISRLSGFVAYFKESFQPEYCNVYASIGIIISTFIAYPYNISFLVI